MSVRHCHELMKLMTTFTTYAMLLPTLLLVGIPCPDGGCCPVGLVALGAGMGA